MINTCCVFWEKLIAFICILLRKLRVFENVVLRRIFGPMRDEVTGGMEETA